MQEGGDGTEGAMEQRGGGGMGQRGGHGTEGGHGAEGGHGTEESSCLMKQQVFSHCIHSQPGTHNNGSGTSHNDPYASPYYH